MSEVSVENSDISHNSGNVAFGNHNTLNVNNNEGAVIFHGDVPKAVPRELPISFIGQDFKKLIGRERQLEKLLEGLADSDSNRIELSAPDGWGKTVLLRRLAHAAVELVGDDGQPLFPSGATKVSCAGLGLTDVLNTVHRQFYEPPLNHVSLYLDHRTISGQLKKVRALIILDDVELDAASAGEIYDLCSGSQFVIARQSAVLSPLDGAAVRLRGLRADEAVELFRAIVDFEGEAAEKAAAEIVELLERRPLTIMRVAQLALDAADDEGVDVDMVGLLDGLRSGSFSKLGQLSPEERQTLGDVLSVTAPVPAPVVRLLPGDASVLERPGFAGAAASPVRLDPELRESTEEDDDESHMRLLAAIGEWIDRGDAVIDDVRFVAGVLKEVLPTARRLGEHDLAFEVVKNIDPLMSKSGMVGLWNDLASEAVSAAENLGRFERAWAAMQAGATSLAKGGLKGDVPVVARLRREWAARKKFSAARKLFKSLGSGSGVAKARHNMFVASRLLYLLLGSAAVLAIGGGTYAVAQGDPTPSVSLEAAGDWLDGDRAVVDVCGTPVVYVEGSGFSPRDPDFVAGCFAERRSFEAVREISLGPTGPGELAAQAETRPRNLIFRLRLKEPPPQAGNRLQVPANSTVVFELLDLERPTEEPPVTSTPDGTGSDDTVPDNTVPDNTVPTTGVGSTTTESPTPTTVPVDPPPVGQVWTFTVELSALNPEAEGPVTVDFCIDEFSMALLTAGAVVESQDLPLDSQCWIALDETSAAHYELRVGDSIVGDQVTLGADRTGEVVDVVIVPDVARRTTVELSWSSSPDFDTSDVPEFELRCDGEPITADEDDSPRQLNFDVPSGASCAFVSPGPSEFRWRRRLLEQPFEPSGDIFGVTGVFVVPSWRVGVTLISRFEGLQLTASGCGLPESARVVRRTGPSMPADGDDTTCELVVDGELPAGAVASYFIDDPRDETELILGVGIELAAEDPSEVGYEAVRRVTIIVADTGDILEFESSSAGAPEDGLYAPTAALRLECKNALGEFVTSAQMSMSLAANTVERRRSHAGSLDLSDCSVVHAAGSDAMQWADFSVRRDQRDRPYFPAEFKISVTRTFDDVTFTWDQRSPAPVGDVAVTCVLGDRTIASVEVDAANGGTAVLHVPKVEPTCELVVDGVSGTADIGGVRGITFTANRSADLGRLSDGQTVTLSPDAAEVELQVSWDVPVVAGALIDIDCGGREERIVAPDGVVLSDLPLGTQCRVENVFPRGGLSLSSSRGVVIADPLLVVGARFTLVADAKITIGSDVIEPTATVTFNWPNPDRDGPVVTCGDTTFLVPGKITVEVGSECVTDEFFTLDASETLVSLATEGVKKLADHRFRVDGSGRVDFNLVSGPSSAKVTFVWAPAVYDPPAVSVECGAMTVLSEAREFNVDMVDIGSSCDVRLLDDDPPQQLRSGSGAPIEKIEQHVFRVGGEGTIGLDLGEGQDMVCQSLLTMPVALHASGVGSFEMPDVDRELIVEAQLVWAGGADSTSLTLNGDRVPSPTSGASTDLTKAREWTSWSSEVTEMLRRVESGTVDVVVGGWAATGRDQERSNRSCGPHRDRLARDLRRRSLPIGECAGTASAPHRCS